MPWTCWPWEAAAARRPRAPAPPSGAGRPPCMVRAGLTHPTPAELSAPLSTMLPAPLRLRSCAACRAQFSGAVALQAAQAASDQSPLTPVRTLRILKT